MNTSAIPTGGSVQRSSRRLFMALLESGRIVSDPWQKLADDAALPSGPCILSLSRLQQDEAVRAAPHLRLGVALPVDQLRGGPLLVRLSALRTQRAGPVRPSPNDTTRRAAEY